MDIYLTKFQIEKYNSKGELKLTKNALKKPNVKFPLSNAQFQKLKRGEEVLITSKKGGFLPIAPIVAGVAGLVSAGTSIYNSYANKKANEQLVQQKKRQNDILEKQNKEGKPISINTLDKDVKDLIESKKGNALYLKKVVLNSKSGSSLCNNKNSISKKNLELESLIISSKNRKFL